jgi:ferredoxin-NADP reductase
MTGQTEPNSTSGWMVATVDSVHTESPRVKLFRLKMPGRRKFRAGQYFDIRLTAPDGYQAQRSYSISSSPEEPEIIELAIELIPDGEVSSYFHEAVEEGEQIELRGPIGGHFTWTPEFAGSVLLIAGGSGIAPLMSMFRHRSTSGTSSPMLLIFSVRTESDILFRRDLEQMAREDPHFDLLITLTRGAPDDWTGESRRIDGQMIETALGGFGEMTTKRAGVAGDTDRAFERAYVCGGTDFVESIASHLLESGMDYNEIRTERFGP